MPSWDDDSDRPPPPSGRRYDPIQSMRGELASLTEEVEILCKKIDALERVEATRVDREKQSDRAWARVQWLLGIVVTFSLASLGTGIRSCAKSEAEIEELRERQREHVNTPYHSGTRETLSSTREDLASIRTQVVAGNRVNERIEDRLEKIEERLTKRR